MACPDVKDRVLVVLFLKGGNDGVNSLIPINEYDTYAGYRPGIAIADSGANAYIPLDNTLPLQDQVGLHPVMGAFKAMYDNGHAKVIQSVGYPNFNGSHFKSTDLWMSGGDGTPANNNLNSGWLGRFLDTGFPGLYGNPITEYPDPLGIQLGDRKPALGFYSNDGFYIASNLTQQEPGGLYDSVQGIGTSGHSPLAISEYGNQIAHIMQVENSTNVYAQRITDVFNAGTNSSVTYPMTDLGNQFKTVAKLLSGGSKTKVFLLHIGGFDTHAAQAEPGSSHLGAHADLLADMFNSVKAFHDDLANLGIEQRVMTSAFSEFGRQLIENGSLGTDHGNMGPVFIFGSAVQGGIVGNNIDLLNITSGGKPDESQLQFVMDATMFGPYSLVPNLVATTSVVDPTCYLNSYIDQIQIRAQVFLEGFYDTVDNAMRTDLAQKGLIPLVQPFNAAPFNYAGAETASSIPLNIADWVLLELRDGTNINTVIGRQAALLRADGQVVDTNGKLGMTMRNVQAGDYYLVIYHRNHIAVVSATPQSSSGSVAVYDFTASATAAYGTGQLKDIGGGIFAMHAGDFDSSGVNDVNDYNNWKANASAVNEYLDIDGDGNGIVNNQDYNLWKRNQNQTGDPLIQL
jgi:uncharacterized protein (DUF1501 family)